MACGKTSAAGSVSQRACVFCGSRVVLYPISDALHIVHGPSAAPLTLGTFAARSPAARNCIATVFPPTSRKWT